MPGQGSAKLSSKLPHSKRIGLIALPGASAVVGTYCKYKRARGPFAAHCRASDEEKIPQIGVHLLKMTSGWKCNMLMRYTDNTVLEMKHTWIYKYDTFIGSEIHLYMHIHKQEHHTKSIVILRLRGNIQQLQHSFGTEILFGSQGGRQKWQLRAVANCMLDFFEKLELLFCFFNLAKN